MHIHWLLPLGSSSLAHVRGSNMASIRMRAATAAEMWASQANNAIQFGDFPAAGVRILVIGKIGADCQSGRDRRWLKAISVARNFGARVVLDYTDNHLALNSPMTSFYRAVLPLVDELVVPSKHMRELVSSFWAGAVTVIPDPVEIPLSAVGLCDKPVSRVLWFGHATNVQYLTDFIQAHDFVAQPFELLALSNEAALPLIDQAMRGRRMMGRLGVWSLEQMRAWANECQACIIPSNPDDPKKSGASSNRLITALALGLPVAADPLPAYLEFSAYFVRLRDPEFKNLLLTPVVYRRSVERAQREVLPAFHRDGIGSLWVQLFQRLGADVDGVTA